MLLNSLTLIFATFSFNLLISATKLVFDFFKLSTTLVNVVSKDSNDCATDLSLLLSAVCAIEFNSSTFLLKKAIRV